MITLFRDEADTYPKDSSMPRRTAEEESLSDDGWRDHCARGSLYRDVADDFEEQMSEWNESQKKLVMTGRLQSSTVESNGTVVSDGGGGGEFDEEESFMFSDGTFEKNATKEIAGKTVKGFDTRIGGIREGTGNSVIVVAGFVCGKGRGFVEG